MGRGPLYQPGYYPQFSGHETFPLRYGWLKKAFDAVAATENAADNKTVFLNDDAIARFGVGRNMVAAMRHWASVADVIADGPGPNQVQTTLLGRKLFGPHGVDPFMENPATLWLVHWQLSAHPDKTTWFWTFGHFFGMTFERESLVKGLEKLATEQAWSRVAAATIKRDVDCFVRTYVARPVFGHASHEDALESPLAELGLIKPVGRRDGFRFMRGAKSTLGNGVFVFALLDFWSWFSKARTLSFEAIAHEPGSPGRVFLLDENDVADRLLGLEEITGGALRWSETAGLKQVLRSADLSHKDALGYIRLDYHVPRTREAA